eukprot:410273-Pleurochrysis_carterae.AAC.2
MAYASATARKARLKTTEASWACGQRVGVAEAPLPAAGEMGGGEGRLGAVSGTTARGCAGWTARGRVCVGPRVDRRRGRRQAARCVGEIESGRLASRVEEGLDVDAHSVVVDRRREVGSTGRERCVGDVASILFRAVAVPVLSAAVAARPPLRGPSFAIGRAELACVVRFVLCRAFVVLVVLLSFESGSVFHLEGSSAAVGEKPLISVA